MPEVSTASRYINAASVRQICGGVSDMSLWRWGHDPKLNFPKPTNIRNRRYWREFELLAWLETQRLHVAVAAE